MRTTDEKYLEKILSAVSVCAEYKPKFGKGRQSGLTMSEFQEMYRNDPLYSWFGLDNPLMYAAHKAAGGMTSVYRQIGIGCERLFQEILQDEFHLSDESVKWSYKVAAGKGKTRSLHLDGRIALEDVQDKDSRDRVRHWMALTAHEIGVSKKVLRALDGVVFEVRQGYKSKDSKRQNADIANAASAYANGYLPCALIMSTQIDGDILTRYRAAKWVMLTGTIGANDPLNSTYDFMREVIGYDLAAFFDRNTAILQETVGGILMSLLTSEE